MCCPYKSRSTTKVVNVCVCVRCVDYRRACAVCSPSVEDPSSGVVHSGYQSPAPQSFNESKQSAFLGAQQLTDKSTPAPWRPWYWLVRRGLTIGVYGLHVRLQLMKFMFLVQEMLYY